MSVPVSQAAALVTNGYRAQLLNLRDTTALAIVALLDSIDLDVTPARLAAALASWRARAVTIVGASQEQAGTLSLQYLVAYLTTSGVDPAIENVEPERAATPPIVQVQRGLFWQLGQNAGRAAAVGYGAALAQRIARSSVQDVATGTLARGITASPTVSGWRRTTSSSCCGRCAAAAAQGVHSDRERFRSVHPADRCTQEPVVAGIAERVLRAAPQVVAP